MDEDEDRPPRIPAPRRGGHDDPGHPVVPAPRRAPALECIPHPTGTVTTITDRSTPPTADRAPSSALVLSPGRSTALAVRDESVGSRLRAFGREVARVVARVVGAAVQGMRSLLEGLAPCPSAR